MNNNPQPPNINHKTTPQILKQTTTLLTKNPLTFLFLTSLILTFRSNVQTTSSYLSSLIDSDTSLKTLFTLPPSPHLPTHPHRRRAFLHLSRVGTLDDEFFSGDSHFDRSLFHPSSPPPLHNSTSILLSRFHEYSFNSLSLIVKPGIFSFKRRQTQRLFAINNNNNNNNVSDNDEDIDSVSDSDDTLSEETETGEGKEGKREFKYNWVLNLNARLNVGQRDQELFNSSLFLLAGLVALAYAYVVLAFIVTYTWVNGMVFVKVIDHLLGNYRSLFRTIWDGSNIGFKRLSGFVLMKWAVMDALAQLIGILFYGEIEDQYVFFKVFVRMKFMPFGSVAPWVVGSEWESSGFIVVYFLSDLVLGFMFNVGCWVAVVNSRRGGREIVKEGCHMLIALFCPAFELRWLEAVVCGSVGRWVLRRMFGDVFTLVFQSLMEVYFMVAWLVFYLAARHKDDTSLGRTFGRRELEGLLEVAR